MRLTIRHVVFREMAYRKLNTSLMVVSASVAVGCLVGALALLDAYDVETSRIISAKSAALERRMATLQDDYRKITKKLGFNVLILPKGQRLSDLYAEDFASKFMPESYVKRLADSGIMSVNHLLPTLQQKVTWPERKRTIVLMGTRGEVPIACRVQRKEILTAVEPGTIVVGYELHRSEGLKVGDKVGLLGREFTVAQCREELGSKDDITIWIDLAEAQSLLGKHGRINAILALSCFCSGERLGGIREEIASILPDTQVIEFASRAVARAEARARAAREAEQSISAEQAGRARLRARWESFAAVLMPVVVVGSVVWIGFLALGNVRDRRGEIGILRAVGVGSRPVFLMFLGKAALVGFIGACVGYAAGFLVAWLFGGSGIGSADVFDFGVLIAVVLASSVICGLASWVPAAYALREDPANVLREL